MAMGMSVMPSSVSAHISSNLSTPPSGNESEVRMKERYIYTLALVLLQNGAPTYRALSCLQKTADALKVDVQFLFVPGSMHMFFNDSQDRTALVKTVDTCGAADLGKLEEIQVIYKDVGFRRTGVLEGIQRLRLIGDAPKKFNKKYIVLAHGTASAAAGLFAFRASSWWDLLPCLLLGCLTGCIRIFWETKPMLSKLFLEPILVILMTIFSRAIGMIRLKGTYPFCPAAVLQSSIVLILPGFLLLLAVLEMQSRSLIAGPLALLKAFLVQFALDFGMTTGDLLFEAVAMRTKLPLGMGCAPKEPSTWHSIPWVCVFAVSLAIIFQAKLRQIPIMCILSAFHQVVSHFYKPALRGQPLCLIVAVGASTIGFAASFRRFASSTSSAMVPAVCFLVPSALSVAEAVTVAKGRKDQGPLVALSTLFETVQVAFGIWLGLYVGAGTMYMLKMPFRYIRRRWTRA